MHKRQYEGLIHTSCISVWIPFMPMQKTSQSLARFSKGSSNFSYSHPNAILENLITVQKTSTFMTSLWPYQKPRGLQLKSQSWSEQHQRLLSIRQHECPMFLQLSNQNSFFQTAPRYITPSSTQEPTSKRVIFMKILPLASPTSARPGQSIQSSPVLMMRSETLKRCLQGQVPRMFLVFTSLAFRMASCACSLNFCVMIFSLSVVSTRAASLFFSSFCVLENSQDNCLKSSFNLSKPPEVAVNFSFRTSISVFWALMISQYSYSLALTSALNLGQSMNISSLIFAQAISTSFQKFCRWVSVSLTSFFIPYISIKNLESSISSCLRSKNRSSKDLVMPLRAERIFSTGLLLKYMPILISSSFLNKNKCSLILKSSSSIIPSMYFSIPSREMFSWIYLASLPQRLHSECTFEMFSNLWSRWSLQSYSGQTAFTFWVQCSSMHRATIYWWWSVQRFCLRWLIGVAILIIVRLEKGHAKGNEAVGKGRALVAESSAVKTKPAFSIFSFLPWPLQAAKQKAAGLQSPKRFDFPLFLDQLGSKITPYTEIHLHQLSQTCISFTLRWNITHKHKNYRILAEKEQILHYLTILVAHLQRYPIRRFSVSMCSRPLQPLFSHLLFDEVLCEGLEEDWEATLALIFGKMRTKKVTFTQPMSMEVLANITAFVHAQFPICDVNIHFKVGEYCTAKAIWFVRLWAESLPEKPMPRQQGKKYFGFPFPLATKPEAIKRREHISVSCEQVEVFTLRQLDNMGCEMNFKQGVDELRGLVEMLANLNRFASLQLGSLEGPALIELVELVQSEFPEGNYRIVAGHQIELTANRLILNTTGLSKEQVSRILHLMNSPGHYQLICYSTAEHFTSALELFKSKPLVKFNFFLPLEQAQGLQGLISAMDKHASELLKRVYSYAGMLKKIADRGYLAVNTVFYALGSRP